ncbi:17836_t:CDS:2, partial [Cetraspora pellucida]
IQNGLENPKLAKKLTTKNKENLQLETSSSVRSYDLTDNSNIKSNEEQITSNSTLEDREMFCEIHYMETTIVPNGIQKGYLTEINFALLNFRIVQMKDELLNIINRKTKVIIMTLLLDQVDYLLEVLVPETALHLISQDRGNIELEDLKKIIEDSSAFGDYIHADLTN